VKVVVIFIATSVIFMTLFYFYPAEIFECWIVEADIFADGGEVGYKHDSSLGAAFFNKDFPKMVNPETLISIAPTWKGYMIMIVCFFGLPAMVAWRSTVKRTPRPKGADNQNIEAEAGEEPLDR
jgi:hypothetical protein